jgi:hypothetical protein
VLFRWSHDVTIAETAGRDGPKYQPCTSRDAEKQKASIPQGFLLLERPLGTSPDFVLAGRSQPKDRL